MMRFYQLRTGAASAPTARQNCSLHAADERDAGQALADDLRVGGIDDGKQAPVAPGGSGRRRLAELPQYATGTLTGH